jgi:hypothetical protein
MSLTKCEDCGAEISLKAESCPQCGWKRPRTKWWLWLPVGLVGAFLAYGAMQPANPEKDNARRVIDLCWADHERPSLGAAERQIIAGTCERLEADFRSKYNAAP